MTQNEIIDKIVELFNVDLNTTLIGAGLDPVSNIEADAPTPDPEQKECLVFPGIYTNDDQSTTTGVFIQFQLPGEVTATGYQNALVPYLLSKLIPRAFELTTRNITIMPFNSGELGGGGSSFVICDLTLTGDLDSCD